MMTKCFLNNSRKVIKSCSQPLKRKIYNNVTPLSKVCQEIEIKVPWGKVAGKLWGSDNEQPLLAVHGWQDNAGTFDNIAPLLLENASILAIDNPGHGLSTWLPPGLCYGELTYLMLIQRIKRHFGWEKVKFLSHSMSAQVSFWHAATFPEQTEFVIALDALKPPTIEFNEFYKILTKAIGKFYEIEKISTLASLKYSEEEVIERWSAATDNSLDEAACKLLMKRATTQVEDGKYVLNRDPRLKLYPFLLPMNILHVEYLANNITCPYLMIKADNSFYFDTKVIYYHILDIMKKNKNFEHYVVPGKHHVHITNPNVVAEVINPFLEKYNK